MMTMVIVCLGGSYLLLPKLIDCQPDWKKIYCGSYNTSILAILIVMLVFAYIGVLLSAYVLSILTSKIQHKHTLIPFYFIKSIEIGGLVYCEFCLMISPYMTPENVKANEAWCIPIPSFLLALIIVFIIIVHVYLMILVSRFDEEIRNHRGHTTWIEKSILEENETVTLNLLKGDEG